ncbi:YciI family protein [Emticicia soli]|uniref:YciI family protein n=1 Tax=Emticicia soli TaxID=2027878 RepID=A0ABW5J328_9BACT
MNQYVIIARDGTDEQAIDRRMAARPTHLEGVKNLKDNNQYISGGAILDDSGKMIGSVMILQFETDQEMQAWYNSDSYITQNVWQTIEIKSFRVANV